MVLESLKGKYGTARNLSLLALFAFICILVLALTLSFREIDSPDIGLHLAPGKWMLSHLSFPTTEIFTYGASGNSYVDLYWLYQVTVAILERLGGPLLLVSFNALFILAALTVMCRRSLAGPEPPVRLALLMLLLVAATANYEIRPHVISWTYLGLLLFVWEGFDRDHKKSLLPVPIIMWLWANTQPTFVLGLIVTGTFWLSLTLKEKKFGKKETLASLLALAVCFLNPYFAKGVTLPFVQFGFLQSSSVFKELIAEYSPLPFLPRPEDTTLFGSEFVLKPMFVLQLLRIVLAAVLLVQIVRGKLRLHETILCVVFFYLNTLAEKNIGYFLFAVVPFAVRSFGGESSIPEQHGRQRRATKRISRFIATVNAKLASRWGIRISLALVGIAAVLFALRVLTNDFYSTQRLSHRFGFAYNNRFLPVHAADFMKRHGLTGRIFNHLDFGGFLINQFPSKVYIDGRNEVMGEDLGREFLETNTNSGLQRLVAKYQPDIILFPHKSGATWLSYVQSDTESWRLV